MRPASSARTSNLDASSSATDGSGRPVESGQPLHEDHFLTTRTGPTVELVIPTLNEAHVIERTVETVRRYFAEQFPYPASILVADNGSHDGTGDIAAKLAAKYEGVSVLRLDLRGRGRALREAWTHSDADIVAYTDVDLSTDLTALERLCRALHEDGADIAIGSRLQRSSETTRGWKREFISRSYNLFIKAVLFTRFSDAQCGFKAVTRRVVEQVVPQIRDNSWFFDTELLVLGEKQGYRIADLPVRWTDDDDSRVKIVSTAWEDIKGVLRLRRHLFSRAFREAKNRALPSPSPSPRPRP
ncbi:MAG: glycosyltransferase family 2 protein [Planctomycetes bacterium]|nr:glycosyltransferase family 2 protein [Planctomycetota bacterium]